MFLAYRTMSEQLSSTPTIEQALEVFVQGSRFIQSFTHPYLAERIGPLWVIRDAPRQQGNYHSEEWIAHGMTPAEIDRIVRQQARTHFLVYQLCGLDEPEEPQRLAFNTLGYRLIRSEPLMTHTLGRIPAAGVPATIVRVMTLSMLKRLTEAAVVHQILPAHLTQDAPLRAYVALIDDQIVGWVRSTMVGKATWCSNMYVHPTFRRRGIARALLTQMLQDDVTHGAQLAVLQASPTGAMLYTAMGYQPIGIMRVFTLGKE
jgi:GNAT superfamily N-acetyltransferase